MSAPAKVLELIKRFAANREAYRSGAYKEDQLRVEFINPLFEALGWDLANAAGYAEPYKDVVHEDALKIGGATKAPDYCFRVGGARKFFVEAKKPSVDVKGEPAPAYQLRRYAWSAKLPLSVLTDFEELAVYDCRVKPHKGDPASAARILYLTFDQFAAKWDELAGIFSREAVLKGSFDKFAEAGRGKKGTAEVDESFLDEIESWRSELAKNIAIRNPRLSVRDLNFSVGRTIDRLIFLRIAEDRGIETYGALLALTNGERVYRRLVALFEKADERYNSGLFHFRHEAGEHEPPDELTTALRLDDEPLAHIIRRLYYPESPYEFSVLPADILGQVYEQFLGKVIRLTKEHHAKVEDKPEVKKAGGVYYTPTYIVDYIVKNTVGKLLEGKTPKQVAGGSLTPTLSRGERGRVRGGRGAPLRVLDPACGSGSFLIGAYQYLLDWYCDRYAAEGPEKHRKELYQGPGGLWRLSTAERKRILLAHIYGVDIDPQAVEVTKLSLLLKVLEGESGESLKKQLQIFHERALPDLGANIKCGNSLIGPDFYQGQQTTMFGEEERYRVNAFDWRSEFAEVFRHQDTKDNGGFHCVIGNPPYVYRNATEESLRTYYLNKYKCAEGNYELYKFFVERDLAVARDGGYIGLIISASFMVQPSFMKLRALLLETAIEKLAPLGPNAFVNATVDTVIMVGRKALPEKGHEIRIQAPARPTDLPGTKEYPVKQARFAENENLAFDYRLDEKAARIARRICREFPPIEKGYEFGVGINTGFIREELVADRKVDNRYHPMVAGNGISRYGPVVCKQWIMYDKDFVRKKGSLGRSLPAEHLLSEKKILVVRTRNLSLPRRIVATLDESKAYNLNRLSNIVARSGYNLQGLLGILNSRLFNWLFSTRYFDYEIKPVYLRNAPLADANNASLIKHVQRMLELQKKLAAAKSPDEQTRLAREIASTDSEIDRLVYELYGLTKEEIAIVEESK